MSILFSFIFAFQLFGFTAPEPDIWQINNHNFEKFDISHRPIDIFQDSRGLLWFGTKNGVVIYDGLEIFEISEDITDTSVNAFKGQEALSIAEDEFGRIWIATRSGGLNVFDKGKITHLNLETVGWSPQSDYGYEIFIQDSVAWFGTRTSLTRIQITENISDLKFEEFPLVFENHGIIHEFLVQTDGKIYGLGRGMFEVSYTHESGISLDQVFYNDDYQKDFIVDQKGNLIIGGWNDLYILKDNQLIARHDLIFDDVEEIDIWSIYQDKDGYVWLGTRRRIIRLEFDEDYNIIDTLFFGYPGAEDIIQDRSGNLYFAAGQEAFLKLNSNYQKYETLTFPSKYRNQFSFLYIEDQNGKLWIGGGMGTFIYDPNTDEFITNDENPNLVEGSFIHAMVEDDEGNIWVGTTNSIFKYDVNTLEVEEWKTRELKPEYFNSDNSWFGAYNMVKDHFGNIWLIVQNTTVWIDPEKNEFKFYGEGGETVDKIIIGSENKLWTWTTDWNLKVYDLNKDGLIWNDDIYLKNTIQQNMNQLVDDGNGRIWFSWIGGVLLLDKKTKEFIQKIDNKNVLRNTIVDSVNPDSSGLMWINQKQKGSIAVNAETLEKAYETQSWLVVNDDGHVPKVSSFGKEGRIYTDGFGGTVIFNTDLAKGNPIPPTVSLKSLYINQERVQDVWYLNTNNNFEFKHYQNNVEFELAAFQFDNPKSNNYSFYIDGVDEEWIVADESNIGKYYNLSPGRYTLFSKASNSDGIWSEPVELATFRILPPWWANPIAYTIYLIIIAFISYRFYSVQLNKKIAESEAHRLKEVDQFKTQFFTNISHEFRTPLTVIMGLADRIQHESIPIIQRNASKLLELINQILELSKVKANQASLKKDTIELVHFSKYILESLQSLATERGIDLSFESKEEELWASVDKQKLELIYHNLLSNALKFTNSGGTVRLILTKKEENFHIEVSDTGIGISKKDLNHIFDRFFQSDVEEHTYKGTGIGLALTNELVRLMNGEIIVESEPGVGSTFYVSLPYENAVPEESETPIDEIKNQVEKLAYPEGSEVILLIEDNNDVRAFVKQVLGEQYQIVTASNGKEGVEKAIEQIPDLIVSDVMMPFKDGFEVTDELKQDTRTSHIPIILLTAKADAESRISGLKTGADVYLAKPFNEEELKTYIQNLIKLRNSIRTKYSGEINTSELGNSLEDAFVKRIHDTLLEQLDDEDFGIDELCRFVGVSRTQLHRKLKALTGKPTSIFIRDIRLSEARKLLRSTSDNISEIAYKVGFGDPNYFSKLYSEKYAHSPSKERETVN